jgi:hypothetical protein
MNSPEARVKLSVVVVCYEMAAQIGNTLRSLLPPYQLDVETGGYEIILIDNGSAKIFDDETRTPVPARGWWRDLQLCDVLPNPWLPE